MKLHEVLRRATERLSSVSPTARLDAEVLVAHVLGLDRAALIAARSRSLDQDVQRRAESLIDRRAHGEPVAYLTGQREFWSLPLAVTPAVLIPRPESELLVERVLAHIPAGIDASIADLGTGSGAIALAIARERPRALVTGSDVSPAALGLAQRNARRLNVGNANFRHAAYLAAFGQFNLIVSNPPYVAEGDPHLADLRFEPATALASGPDGLDALRVIVREAFHHLRAPGWLLVEHGAQQGAAVRALFAQAGFTAIETRRDLAGHERATGGRRA